MVGACDDSFSSAELRDGSLVRMPMRCPKVIALLSGGLDSLLATRLVQTQGAAIHAIHFLMPFSPRGASVEGVEEAARRFGWELELVRMGEVFVEMVRHPRYGYGKHLNPCVDCRVFTLSLARVRMEQTGAVAVVTGEVLGQRPMSQRRDAMRRVERESGLEGRLLRPLCAKHLKPTIAEQEGVIKREGLLDLSGRTRKPQMALAEKLGIGQYPAPAGGCLLTDEGFARRLRDLFARDEATLEAIQLLKVGRHFRLGGGQKVIAGRDEAENLALERMVDGDVVRGTAAEVGGAMVMLFGEADEDALGAVARICARYCADRDREQAAIRIWKERGSEGTVVSVSPMTDEELSQMRV